MQTSESEPTERISVTVPASLVKSLDDLARQIAARQGRGTRSDAARILMLRGLAARAEDEKVQVP